MISLTCRQSTARTVSPGEHSPVLTLSPSTSEGSSRSLTDRMEARGIFSVAVRVVQNGETGGYGVADSTGRPGQVDAPFLIGSQATFAAHWGVDPERSPSRESVRWDGQKREMVRI